MYCIGNMLCVCACVEYVRIFFWGGGGHGGVLFEILGALNSTLFIVPYNYRYIIYDRFALSKKNNFYHLLFSPPGMAASHIHP